MRARLLHSNKAFNIFPEAYRLNILPPPVLTTESVDKIVRRYSCLPLAQADNFHKAPIEHKIARFNIIIAQAANQAFALKTTLGGIQNCKVKMLEQLEILAAIKNNNMQIEATIAKEQAGLDCIYLQSTN